jgi:enediyne polyketide synthase
MKTVLPAVAIVGMACIYPDARTPGELWENVLAQRRAFRRLPAERLRAEDYFSPDRSRPDHTYSVEAAVIEGFEFDRAAFRVAGSAYRSADLAHWLALDVAAKALADAGFIEGKGLPRATTGVLLGNSLTGEFSRANVMRLRWPYVRRVVEAALVRERWKPGKRRAFLSGLELEYKSPFPPVDEETLAGGLSNTIAGRICNHFDLKGGGHTVDGACASSLLAVANACSALTNGDLDVALAGGVDLSLDPFELTGFAKLGALAAHEMRVFDERSAGFWPGEGCGFVTLMRHEDALAQGHRVYAVIRGWGISSDGKGGITRPGTDGQLEALHRAYRRAGFGFDTVMYCEAHGTGTPVGDAIELEVLARARRQAGQEAPVGVIGSVKANIGHTKAAAGLAGLINATMAVHTQVLPPTTGSEQPHPLLTGPKPALRLLHEPEVWPEGAPLRACVSGMGFGGINAHIVLESFVAQRRTFLSPGERLLARSSQDAELFLLSARTAEALVQKINVLLELAGRLSRAELADVADSLRKRLESSAIRAALIASKPAELLARLETLKSWLQGGVTSKIQTSDGVFLGSARPSPRIAFLFPGQGSPAHLDGGIWRRRFESVRDLYARAEMPEEGDPESTSIMQPAVVTASLAGLMILSECGIAASAAVGHSLGEITAMHWAGVFEEAALLRIAHVRGKAMAEMGSPDGAMAAITAPSRKVGALIKGEPLAVVGFNSCRQTVVAGDAAAVKELTRRACAKGWHATLLRVSHAFHTPLVAGAVPVLAGRLASEHFSRPVRRLVSTITGGPLDGGEDLRQLLCKQVTAPVRFDGALKSLLGKDGGAFDLLIEVGPGDILSRLASDTTEVPAVALDACGASLIGLLQAAGAAFALGVPVKTAALFEGRFTRSFDLDRKLKFFSNPCELAPLPNGPASENLRPPKLLESRQAAAVGNSGPPGSREFLNGIPNGIKDETRSIELIRGLVSKRTELPVAEIRDESRLLGDLHLNSIDVGQLVSEAARRLRLAPVAGLNEFADASVEEIARSLDELKSVSRTFRKDDPGRQPPGVDSWIREFTIELVGVKRSARRKPTAAGGATPLKKGGWQVFAPENHPLAAGLLDKFGKAESGGVVLCLPERTSADQAGLMLEAARALAGKKTAPRFVVVQHGWGGSGFAKTLHLEMPGLTTCVVNVPAVHRRSAEWIVEEALAASGFCEVHYDAKGRRREGRLKLAPFPAGEPAEFPIGPGDVLLVTGGGKGIAAECALALARETGVRLALLGRSNPKTDKELAENLARMKAAGARFCYLRTDVLDEGAVKAAVAEVNRKLGLVTAFLHGAGTNTPRLISALNEAAFRCTVAPKIQGFRNVLAAIDPARLRLLVTFGSIIARSGLRGEGDYAAANEWLTASTVEFQSAHPQCRCLALEWSVWSGVGMGERLGRVESLLQQGIMPITPDEGVRILLGALRNPGNAMARVITGRFGEPATLKLHSPELPLRRFLDRKRAYYAGVELIVEADLSLEADPYLRDHILQKQMLFPAVFGLEALAQTAMALAETTATPMVENVEWLRPITVSDGKHTTIRISALKRTEDLVEVCIRSEETDFQADHVRALCRFGPVKTALAGLCWSQPGKNVVRLEPERDLYGGILFHEGKFRRLRSYRLLKAGECLAEITPDTHAPWFGPYLPGGFVLGDPGARDAALHAIQACIPHLRILPVGVERVTIHQAGPGPHFVRAKERKRDGSNFIYDLEVTDEGGAVIECWSGLRLRAVAEMPQREAWPEALLAAYLERRLEELTQGAQVSVAFERRMSSDTLMQQALGRPLNIWRRPDGKPMTNDHENVSASHSNDLTLAVAGGAGAACDLEMVVSRSDREWRDLLGGERFKLAGQISRPGAEGMDTATTRLWAATECLKKAGVPVGAPLTLESCTTDGWVLFRSGAIVVATCAVAVENVNSVLIAAVAAGSRKESRQPRARVVEVAA